MSALPLGVLTCQDSAGPTPVYFHYQEQCCRAVVVCTAPSGILVCIPRGGVSPQEFEEAETSGYVGAIGPFSEVEVAGGMNWKANKLLDVLVHWRWAPALLSKLHNTPIAFYFNVQVV